MSVAYIAVPALCSPKPRPAGGSILLPENQSPGPHWPALKQKAGRNLQMAGNIREIRKGEGSVAQSYKMQSIFLFICVYMCI